MPDRPHDDGAWAGVRAFLAELAWIVGLTALVVLVLWLLLSAFFAPRPARADRTTAPLKSLCRRYVTAQLGLARLACATDPQAEAACVSGLRLLGKQARRDCRHPPPAIPVPPVMGLSLDAAMARMRLRGMGASLTLLEEPTPKAMVQAQVPGPGGMVRPGGTAQLAVSLPPQGEFLTFFGGVQSTEADAESYYDLIDPAREKDTLTGWLRANGWYASTGQVTTAVYSNEFDLGFGRRMHVREDVVGLSYYVVNFVDADTALAARGEDVLATVAMEYEFAKEYVTFYAFGPDGVRIPAIDLDGRGAKPVPEGCAPCHGSRWQPGSADIGGRFIPFTPELYGYAAGTPRETQMDAFRRLNATLLRTNPPEATRGLLTGLYGGDPHSLSAQYDKQFVPSGWNNTPEHRMVYRTIVASACRGCHLNRPEPQLDFDTAAEFYQQGPRIRQLIGSGQMPKSLRTWQRFWLSNSPHRPNILLSVLP